MAKSQAFNQNKQAHIIGHVISELSGLDVEMDFAPRTYLGTERMSRRTGPKYEALVVVGGLPMRLLFISDVPIERMTVDEVVNCDSFEVRGFLSDDSSIPLDNRQDFERYAEVLYGLGGGVRLRNPVRIDGDVFRELPRRTIV